MMLKAFFLSDIAAGDTGHVPLSRNEGREPLDKGYS